MVFGTSLSDPGNAFALRGGTNTPPDYLLDPLLIPSAPYAGAAITLAMVRHGSSSLHAAVVSPAACAQRSWRGIAGDELRRRGRARPRGRVESEPASAGGRVSRAGGWRRAIQQPVRDRNGGQRYSRRACHLCQRGRKPGASAVLEEANVSIANAIVTLYGAGAREFLVWRAPDVGLTPAIRALDHMSPGAAFLGKAVDGRL